MRSTFIRTLLLATLSLFGTAASFAQSALLFYTPPVRSIEGERPFYYDQHQIVVSSLFFVPVTSQFSVPLVIESIGRPDGISEAEALSFITLDRNALTFTGTPGASETIRVYMNVPESFSAGDYAYRIKTRAEDWPFPVADGGSMINMRILDPGAVGFPPTIELTSPANQSTFTYSPLVGPLTVPFTFTAASEGSIPVQAVDADLNGVSVAVSANGVGTNDVSGGGSLSITAGGNYILRVRATNSEGTSADSLQFNVVVDAPPPTVAITQPLNGASFSYTYGQPALSIPLSFTATSQYGPVNFLTATLNGTPIGISTSGTGTLTATGTSSLNIAAPGSYTINVTGTTAYGTATDSVTFSVAAITPPPSVAINSPFDGAVFQRIAGEPPTNVAFSFSALAGWAGGKIDSLTATLDGAPLTSSVSGLGTSSAQGHATKSFSSGGVHVLAVTTSSGGVQATKSISFAINETVPVVPVNLIWLPPISVNPTVVGGTVAPINFVLEQGDAFVRDENVVISITEVFPDGSESEPALFPYGTDDSTPPDYAILAGDIYELAFPTQSGVHRYQIEVYTSSADGVEFLGSKQLLTEGGTPPTITLTSPSDQSVFTYSPLAGPLSIPFTFTAESEGSTPIDYVDADLNQISVEVTADGIGTTEVSGTGTLVVESGGVHVLRARATNSQGTSSDSIEFTVVVDAPPPSISIAQPFNGAVYSYTYGGPAVTVPLNFMTTSQYGAINSLTAQLNGEPLTISSSGLGSLSAIGSTYLSISTPGTYTIDVAGSTAFGTANGSVTFSVTGVSPPPSVVILSPADGAVIERTTGDAATQVEFLFEAVAGYAGGQIDSLTATLDANPISVSVTGLETYSAQGSATGAFSSGGTHVLSVTTSSGGAIASASVSFTIREIPPVLPVTLTWLPPISLNQTIDGGTIMPINFILQQGNSRVRDENVILAIYELFSDGSSSEPVLFPYGTDGSSLPDYAILSGNIYELAFPTDEGAHRYKIEVYTTSGNSTVLLGTKELLTQGGECSTCSDRILVRQAPVLNGQSRIVGSIQQMQGDSAKLNGNVAITGEYRVPGNPRLELNGKPTVNETKNAGGSATPNNYSVTLSGQSSIGTFVRQVDSFELPVVEAPLAPTGTRTVTINKSKDSVGAWSTVRNLTLNGNVGQLIVPPGRYGNFVSNGNKNGFILGVPGSLEPSVYHFQELTLNGQTEIKIVGPVIINTHKGFSSNGSLGNPSDSSWLVLNIHSGGLTLNGTASFYGCVVAPNGTVTLNGNNQLTGGVIADRLVMNGQGLIETVAGTGPCHNEQGPDEVEPEPEEAPCVSCGSTVLVRHAPNLNGQSRILGSIQQILPESLNFNGGVSVTGKFYLPGTPTVKFNGNANSTNVVDGAGNANPSNYTVTINGQSNVHSIVRRTNPVELSPVSAPLAPSGNRTVTINNSKQSVGDWKTVRNLTLNGNSGQFAVPAGSYDTFIANGNKSGFTLGVPGATEPAVYNFQELVLNGQTEVKIVGPVIINLARGIAANGSMGTSSNPSWLVLNIYSGGLTLNGTADFFGCVNAPNGSVILNGNNRLVGGVAADRLVLNGQSTLEVTP